MTSRTNPLRASLAVLASLLLWTAGCQRTPTAADKSPPKQQALPPAYPKTEIKDPRLEAIAKEFKAWAISQRGGEPPGALYHRIELLPPTQTNLPYGIGVYQQENRLPVILTTGPGWSGLKPKEKEARAGQAFGEISKRLATLPRDPPLQPTLTIQTSQGLVLGWINELNKKTRHLHGEDD